MSEQEIIIRRTRWAEHQRKWWDLPNFMKLLVGGYGCGKTWIASLRAIYLSFLNAPIKGMLVSPTYGIAEMTTIPTIKDILAQMEVDYTYVGQPKNMFYIPLWNGHIKIASGDNPISLKGGNMAWAGIDEPFVQKRTVFEEAHRRIRPVTENSELFMTGTPEELNWGYDLCMDTEGKYDIGYVYGKTEDNEFIGGKDGEYYQGLLKSYSEEQKQAYLEGKFLNLLSGRVYKEFDRDKHIFKLDNPVNSAGQKLFRVKAGIDFNVDYMTAEIFWDMKTGVHFIDEIRLMNSNTFDLAEKLRDKYPGIEVYPDPTGSARRSAATKTDHQILRDYGFIVRSRKEVPVRDKVNSTNALLRKDACSIEPGKCHWLVRDWERNTWKSGDIDKSEVELTHASDAAGYAIEYLYPVKRYTAWSG